ncbi:hypothetical protein PTKIN_Ptkin12aG0189600 [Pterospermum kingtungense]
MDTSMAMTEGQLPPPSAAAVQLTELVSSLEQATQMAKQLPATSDPTYLFQIYSSLHQAHHSLSSFLCATQTQFPVPPPPAAPPQPLLPVVAAENSHSATGAANEDCSEPMLVGDENEAEEDSKTSIDKVEEKLRECFIKNKRAKRQLSPSSAVMAEERRAYEDRLVGGVKGFDPLRYKLRALDLVYQFHG